MSGEQLRQRIAYKLQAGDLPRQAPLKRWGGLCHTEHSCQVCGERIHSGDPEIETEDVDGVYRVFHAACSALLEQIRVSG